MAHNDVWRVRASVATGLGITLLQIKASTTSGFEVLSGSLSQRGSTVSEEDEVCIIRKTVGATVSVAVSGGVSGNVFSIDPNTTSELSSSNGPQLGPQATGFNATAEGTDGDLILRQGFNILNGWAYLPVPEERIWVLPGGIIAVKFMAPPGSSNNWDIELAIREL